jgi:hypothetical protein
MRWALPNERGFEKRGPTIGIQHSPIANLENPFAISLINNFPTERITIDSAEGSIVLIAKRCSKSAIGEC